VREKLVRELRRILVEHRGSDALAEIVAGEVRRIAKEGRSAPLLAAAEKELKGRRLVKAMADWLARMPATRRSDWLVDRLSEAGGFHWQAESAPIEGKIPISRKERERIARRLEAVWERSITRHDDEPDPDEYADAVEQELERIGSKYEALATRALTKRFPDGPLTVGFAEWMRRQAFQRPEHLLAFVEAELEIEWTDTSPSAEPRRK